MERWNVKKKGRVQHLHHVCRHHCRVNLYSWWKPQYWLKAPSYVLSFHHILSTTVMSPETSSMGYPCFHHILSTTVMSPETSSMGYPCFHYFICFNLIFLKCINTLYFLMTWKACCGAAVPGWDWLPSKLSDCGEPILGIFASTSGSSWKSYNKTSSARQLIHSTL